MNRRPAPFTTAGKSSGCVVPRDPGDRRRFPSAASSPNNPVRTARVPVLPMSRNRARECPAGPGGNGNSPISETLARRRQSRILQQGWFWFWQESGRFPVSDSTPHQCRAVRVGVRSPIMWPIETSLTFVRRFRAPPLEAPEVPVRIRTGTPTPRSNSGQYGRPCADAPHETAAWGIDSIVFVREASKATLRARFFSSSVAETIPRTFFWFGQIRTQTLNSNDCSQPRAHPR